MNSADFREVLEASWRELDEALAGLDEAAMVEPGVVEDWSVKDLLGHVAAWEQRAIGILERFNAGEQLGNGVSGGTDAFNATESARRSETPLAAIERELADTRARLRALLAALSEEQWQTVVDGDRNEALGAWIGGTLGGPLGPGTHAAEHAHNILVWRVR
jgi:uncharacterized protein (TIGR03083 family)